MQRPLRTLARFPATVFHRLAPFLHHALIVMLSAAIALSLPVAVTYLARRFLDSWALVGNEKTFLIAIELALTLLLILISNSIRRSWNHRKLAWMATAAGLAYVTPSSGFFARRRIRRLKEEHGVARDVMVIGSTGFTTFVDPKGELHPVIQNCREARIMLLHPNSRGAAERARSILGPEFTPDRLAEQIGKAVLFLNSLKASGRNIRLKLYSDVPFLKMSILGDYLWVQHYHAGLDIRAMPRFVFRHSQAPGSLYAPFYQYFLMRWEDPAIPEYDFDADELIYRDGRGNEGRREPFAGKGLAERSLSRSNGLSDLPDNEDATNRMQGRFIALFQEGGAAGAPPGASKE